MPASAGVHSIVERFRAVVHTSLLPLEHAAMELRRTAIAMDRALRTPAV